MFNKSKYLLGLVPLQSLLLLNRGLPTTPVPSLHSLLVLPMLATAAGQALASPGTRALCPAPGCRH